MQLGLSLALTQPRSGGGGGVADGPYAKVAFPRLAVLGGSFMRRAYTTSGSGSVNQSAVHNGILTTIPLLDPRFVTDHWSETTVEIRSNGQYTDGLGFAKDGEGLDSMTARLPKIRQASLQAQRDGTRLVVIMDFTNNSITSSATIGTLIEKTIAITDYLTDAGCVVVYHSAKERGTSIGGIWAAGAASLGSSLVQQWNAWAVPYVATRDNVYFLDNRSIYIDTSNNNQPFEKMTLYDVTHPSSYNGIACAKLFIDEIADEIALPFTARRDRAVSANLLPNADWSLTTAISLTNVTGVRPTNYTLTRGGNTGSVITVTQVTHADGKKGFKFSINRAGMLDDGTIESLLLALSSSAPVLTSQDWYKSGLWRVETTAAGDADWRAMGRVGFDAGTRAAVGNSPSTSDGGAATYGVQYSATPLTLYVDSPSVKASGAVTAGLNLNIGWIKGDGSTIECTMYEPYIVEIDDPGFLLFDRTNVTPASVLTSLTQVGPEDTPLSLDILTSKPCYYEMGVGNDAAQANISKAYGTLTTAAYNFDTPIDASVPPDGTYVYPLIITPYDNRDAILTPSVSFTPYDIPNGFTDAFTTSVGRPSGTSLVGYAPYVAYPGAAAGTNDFTINGSNRLSATTGTAGGTYGNVLAYTGVNAGIQINFNKVISNSAQWPYQILCGQDTNNWLGIRFNASSTITVTKRVAGVNTNIGTYTYDSTYGGNYSMQVNTAGAGSLEVIQGLVMDGVLLVPATGAAALTNLDAQLPASWRTNWIYAGFAINGGVAGFMDNGNWRAATAVNERPGLDNLTISPTTFSYAANPTGLLDIVVTGRTDETSSSTVSISGTGVGVSTWNLDGFFLRGADVFTGLDLSTSKTITIIVSENGADIGSVPTSRSSTFVITLTA